VKKGEKTSMHILLYRFGRDMQVRDKMQDKNHYRHLILDN